MTTAEAFVDEMITAIRQQDIARFRQSYREVDYVLFDDLQHIAGRESTQEEFLNTVNALQNNGGHIAVASAGVPSAFGVHINTLLASRMDQALQFGIHAPSGSDIYLILSRKYNTAEPHLPNRLLNTISDLSGPDVRKADGLARKALFVYSQTGIFPSSEDVNEWVTSGGGFANSLRDLKPSDLSRQRTKILFVAADPSGASRLRLGQEIREIQEQLQLSLKRDHFEINQILSTRPEDLSNALLMFKPNIVHFSGHGTPSGDLCFEDHNGEARPIEPDALADLFELFSSHVDFVVLNACYSDKQAEAIVQKVKYVVGMGHAIDDRSAIAFSIGLYQALCAGRTEEDAYKLGCIQIRLQGYSEPMMPVLKKGF